MLYSNCELLLVVSLLAVLCDGEIHIIVSYTQSRFAIHVTLISDLFEDTSTASFYVKKQAPCTHVIKKNDLILN